MFVSVFNHMASEYFRFAGEFKIDADKAFTDSNSCYICPQDREDMMNRHDLLLQLAASNEQEAKNYWALADACAHGQRAWQTDIRLAVQILNKQLAFDHCIFIHGNEGTIWRAIEHAYTTSMTRLEQQVTPEQIERICHSDVWYCLIEAGPLDWEWEGESARNQLACGYILAVKTFLEQLQRNEMVSLVDHVNFLGCLESIRALYDTPFDGSNSDE